MHILSLILDFLFPRNEEILRLENLSPDELALLLPPADSPLALFDYRDETVKQIIWEIKYKGNKKLADSMGEILFKRISWIENAILIPMPISSKRRMERGWNQAELLCEGIMKHGKFTYTPNALVKVRHTESQTKTVNKEERLENLKDSMKVTSPLSGKFIILIDDVTTTGSTFTEAKRALREARVSDIYCLSVSH